METINQPTTLSTTMQRAEKFTEIATQLLVLPANSIAGDIFSWSRWPQKSKSVFHIFMNKMFSGKICSADNVSKEGRDSIPLYQRYG
jgi:hypothetical protein